MGVIFGKSVVVVLQRCDKMWFFPTSTTDKQLVGWRWIVIALRQWPQVGSRKCDITPTKPESRSRGDPTAGFDRSPETSHRKQTRSLIKERSWQPSPPGTGRLEQPAIHQHGSRLLFRRHFSNGAHVLTDWEFM